MKTAGIAIDKWKLSIFETVLKREGFSYKVHSGVTSEMLLIKVETEFVSDLQPFVEEANSKAAIEMSKKSTRPPNPPTCIHGISMGATCKKCGRGGQVA